MPTRSMIRKQARILRAAPRREVFEAPRWQGGEPERPEAWQRHVEDRTGEANVVSGDASDAAAEGILNHASSVRTLFFEPLDLVLVRDHRPFDAGLHVLAQGRFPPPSTFLGCLRTALLEALGADFRRKPDYGLRQGWARDWLGGATAPGTLALRGPLLARAGTDGVQPYLPWPCNLRGVLRKDASGQQVQGWRVARPLRPGSEEGSVASHVRPAAASGLVPSQFRPVWCAEPTCKPQERQVLTPQGAAWYLAATEPADPGRRAAPPAGALVPEGSLFQVEERTGLARHQETLTAVEGLLYITRGLRLARDHGFAVEVEVEGPDQAEALRGLHGQVVPLGGKAHRARIRLCEQALLPSFQLQPPVEGHFLWLLTPTKLDQVPGGLVAAATTTDALPAGGFDFAARAPRPLSPLLPAGSVLFYGAGKTPCITDSDATRSGHGWALSSGW